MSTKLTVLVFIGNYLPGFKAGGPIRTLVNMVDQLGDEFDFWIVTSDRDLGDAAPYPHLEVNTWIRCGKANVFYRSPGSAGWRMLNEKLDGMHIDLIYMNSLFSVVDTLRPLILRRFGRITKAPVLLAPRGELSSGALQLKSFKKRFFLRVALLLNLFDKITFQASSEHEGNDIRRELGDMEVLIASDLSEQSSSLLYSSVEKGAGTSLRAVFLSRISPKKNLLGALEILKNVNSSIIFDIYGVIEDKGYWSRCKKLIETLPSNVAVNFQGSVRPDEVNRILSRYDFFFFPTLGENYGHVIREALSAGLPILISDQTPWRDLAAKNAGADLSLQAPHDFAAWIEAFANMEAEQRNSMRRAANALGNNSEKEASDRVANRNMLYSAAGVSVLA
ncbi:glycosyltransferase family 4 protein [Notoacmeibacter ruber]|uniref:Glycosyltransferase n=1 Tax=Notoacmeibacter ruber TaxID=2670375 RepID=A0A3L7JA60_9HYPH|nr:glycosyltransferase family 4 protein [Notoacmeibacter ruber]RLQ87380.1 glycosyltransferase [Notoacmeibacter ruber]